MDNLRQGSKAYMSSSLEWEGSRHRLVAMQAEEQLKSANAKQQIAQILKHLNCTSLRDIAIWADTVKRRKPRPEDDQETKDFLNDPQNALNDQWHYVDLPLDVSGYDREKYPESEFTRPDDVVQIIFLCIGVLKNGKERFSRANALHLLVHLVSDLHQPLHVGCCYISAPPRQPATLVKSPAVAIKDHLLSDRGGNDLLVGLEEGKKPTLHSFWDSAFLQKEFVEGLSEETERRYIEMVLSKFNVGRPRSVVNDIYSTIIDWANQSVAASRIAYETISIKEPVGKKYLVSWEGKDKYIARNEETLRERLAAGGSNLATTLDFIWP